MFKASIVLVLLAFAALAYGWVQGNDAILYASIGASALAGLALLRATLEDRKTSGSKGAPRSEATPRPPRPERVSRKVESELDDLESPVPPRRRPRQRPRSVEEPFASEELTEQLGLPKEQPSFLDSSVEPLKPSRPPTRRESGREAERVAWASKAESSAPDLEEQFEESGPIDNEYADNPLSYEEPARGAVSNAVHEQRSAPAAEVAGADDFRSRLAAVLGTDSDEPTMPRLRQPAPDPATRPVRRSPRKVAEDPKESQEPDPEPEGVPHIEPEWIRIDEVPRIARATQPGGGFARPDPPEEITTYRPRRPLPIDPGKPDTGKTATKSTGSAPAKKSAPPKPTPAKAEAAKRSGSSKRPASGTKPAVTRVSGGSKSRRKVSAQDEPPPPASRGTRARKPKP